MSLSGKFATCLMVLCFSVSIPQCSLANNPYQVNDKYEIIEEQGKNGLRNDQGEVIIPPEYEALGWSDGKKRVFNDVIGYRNKGSWGILTLKNEKITPPAYSSLLPAVDKFLLAAKIKDLSNRQTWGIIKTNGKAKTRFHFSALSSGYNVIIASKNKKAGIRKGVLNKRGKEILPIKHLSINIINEETFAIQTPEGKWGLKNDKNEYLLSPDYDSLGSIDEDKIIVGRHGKLGIVNTEGKILAPIEYQDIKKTKDGKIKALPYPEWDMLNEEGGIIQSFYYNELTPFGDKYIRAKTRTLTTYLNKKGKTVFPPSWNFIRIKDHSGVFRNEGKYGVVSFSADSAVEVLPARYDSIKFTHNKFIIAGKSASTNTGHVMEWTVFDLKGKSISEYHYQKVKGFSEGKIAVKRHGHWGYINDQGKEVIESRFQEAGKFKKGRAVVKLSGSYGVINHKGEWVVKPFSRKSGLANLRVINDSLYVYKAEDKQKASFYGLINTSGKELYQSHYQLIDNGNSLWEVTSDSLMGLVNYNGKQLLEPKYDTVSGLQADTIYIYRKDGKAGIVRKDGKFLVSPDNAFQKLYPLSDEFLGIKKEGKYGFVDIHGRLRIANQYEGLLPFHEGIGAIKLLGKWGFIDKYENLVIQPHYDTVSAFKNGLSIVKKEGKFGVIDKSGKQVAKTKYDSIFYNEYGRFVTVDKQGGPKFGLLSKQGRELINPKYDGLKDLNKAFVIVSRNGKYGLISKGGVISISFKYDDIKYHPGLNLYIGKLLPEWEMLTF